MWSLKRRLLVLVIVLAIIIAPIVYIVGRIKAKQVYTCFDKVKNGDETAVDCGGSCVLMCSSDTLPLVTQWAVPIKVTDDIYHMAALVENQNNALGDPVDYTLSMYDANNILVGERKGTTQVPANQSFVITEFGIKIGKRIPTFALLTLKKPSHWYRVDPRLSKSIIKVRDPIWEDMTAGTRLRATVTNTESVPVDAITITAVGFNETDNALLASSTVVDSLDVLQTKDIVFTWPQTYKPKRTQFFVTIDPFKQTSIPLLRDKPHTK